VKGIKACFHLLLPLPLEEQLARGGGGGGFNVKDGPNVKVGTKDYQSHQNRHPFERLSTLMSSRQTRLLRNSSLLRYISTPSSRGGTDKVMRPSMSGLGP
jgi:hypothetical protein